eukprot:TRINITY_DN5649_c0_g1_i6.p1 TRINITY_DN5649_c0_g1~~TRINITY_DN5649_c0_g1_i6.p1  ORF type:complete len:131 (+),score=41.01 TRINITY_DN5649_c0_g1_i6:65-457(+)
MKFAVRALVVLGLAGCSSAASLKRSRLDINQKVYVEGVPVLGDGAGEAALGVCQTFAPSMVKDPSKPEFKVCGTGIKATIFLRNRCEAYYEHSHQIGKCDTSMPSTTCDSISPAQDPRVGTYQSYLIEQC